MLPFTVFLWAFQSALLLGTFSNSVWAQDTAQVQDISEICSWPTDQIIRYYGYEAESYDITTEDGYILKLYRCYSKKFADRTRKPVMLQHGLMFSSDAFTLNPGHQSLAYLLADLGYDVWLPNSRGNGYSRRHLTKNPDDPASGFWNFTFHEMAKFDHPANIDFILSTTKFKKLNYIGHSQGTTTLITLLAIRPEYNCKIKIASLMAPVVFVKDDGHRVKAYFESFLSLRGRINTEFSIANTFDQELYKSLCPGDGCDLGTSPAQTNLTMAPLYICKTGGASVNQFMHFGEMVKYKYFGEFVPDTVDPAGFENTVNYPLSNIATNITLHWSFGDAVTSLNDVVELRSKVKSVVYEQVVSEPTFAHSDFALGINANKLVYEDILRAWKSIDEEKFCY